MDVRLRCFPAYGWLILVPTVFACTEPEPQPAVPQPVARVIVAPDSVRIPNGDTITLSVTLVDAAGKPLAGRAVAWASSNETVALVSSNGLVSTVSHPDTMLRQVTLSATSENIIGTAVMWVGPALVASVDVTTDSPYVMIGRTVQLAATVRDSAGNDLTSRTLSWTSNDSTIARVSSAGEVTGVQAGTAIVSAASGGRSDTVTVTVGNLDVAITTPHPADLVGDTVLVRATVTGIFQIATVTATLGGATVPLTFSGALNRWTGLLPIGGEPFGSQQLRVTATDVFGNTRATAIQVGHDPPPLVAVELPAPGAVASPSVAVSVTCTDRNATACRSVTAQVGTGPILATGTTALSTSISLSAYEGQSVRLLLTGTDSAGQSTTISRDLWVFSGTGLERAVDVPGMVHDFDGARTLYAIRAADNRDILRIRAADGSETIAFDMPGRQVNEAQTFLMPAGAIFGSRSGTVSTDLLHEFRNGSISTLNTGYISTLALTGTFVAWASTPLYLRDLVAGQTTIVATDEGNTEYDVSAAGDVAYWTTGYQIVYVPHGGAAVTLTSGPLVSTYPRTDGTNVVYRKNLPGLMAQIYMTPVTGGEIALGPPSSSGPLPDQDYAVQGGWVAYTQQSPSGERQVWSRSPADVRTQVSFFGTSSLIEAIDANGTIVFANAQSRYESAAPYTTLTPLGAAIGRVRLRAGKFTILLGGSVFIVP